MVAASGSTTGAFWIPLLAILFVWKELQHDPHDHAMRAHRYFLYVIPHAVFWIALVARVTTFVDTGIRLLRARAALLSHRDRPARSL